MTIARQQEGQPSALLSVPARTASDLRKHGDPRLVEHQCHKRVESERHTLNVYGREGRPCKRCGTPIVRERFMNRSSHFCPSCQRKR